MSSWQSGQAVAPLSKTAMVGALQSIGLNAQCAVMVRFADMFVSDNPRFDRARFLAAANGKPSDGRDKVQS